MGYVQLSSSVKRPMFSKVYFTEFGSATFITNVTGHFTEQNIVHFRHHFPSQFFDSTHRFRDGELRELPKFINSIHQERHTTAYVEHSANILGEMGLI